VTDLTALVLSCTLKQSPAESSATLLGEQFLEALREHGTEGEVVRLADHRIRFGVSPDEGDGDQWPAIREKMLAADLLVLATPIWLGQPSSVAKMALERLDAELSETDDQGRMSTYNRVAAVAPTTSRRRYCRRSTTRGSAWPPMGRPTGWARRCRQPTTPTTRAHPTRPPAPRAPRQPTPLTWRDC
jgi:hypothetical protein